MQYDSYRGKVKKVAAFLGRMYAYKTLIILSLVVLTLVVTAMVATKGLMVTESECPATVVYGEKLDFRAGFLFCRTTYEYRRQGETAWTTRKPVSPGNYQVRGMGKTSFGKKNYTAVYDFALLPREIIPVVSDSRITYGDTPTVKADLARGDTLHAEILYSNLTTTTATWVNPDNITITDKQGNDRTSSYIVADTPRQTIRITPRPLTVTVQDASKVYDDLKLTFDGYEISKGTLAAGDSLVAVFNDSITDAGSIENTPRLRIYKADGLEVTALYDMQVRAGKLTVEQRPLVIRAGSASYTYSGEFLDCRRGDVDDTTPLAPGHSLQVQSAPFLRDCGTVENTPTFRVQAPGNRDVTRNYAIFVQAGTLEVTPRAVTVHSESTRLVYNGDEQSCQNVTVENGVGDTVRCYEYATIRDVGSVENRLTVRFFRGDKDITSNYTILGYTYGTITVEPRPLKIRMADDEKPYDGTPLTAGKYMIFNTVYGLVRGHTLTLETEGSVIFGTAVNHYVEGSARVYDADGQDVTKNYDITVTDGILTVRHRPLTVRTFSAEKVYDGTPLSEDGWELESGTLLAGHELRFTAANTALTEVGSVANAVAPSGVRVVDTASGEDVTGYYSVSYDEGTLTVHPRPITVQTLSDEWMYDGRTHESSDAVKLTQGTLVAGHTMEKNSAAITVQNAGKTANTIYVRIRNGEADVTHNYAITYDYGILTVRKRPISVQISSAAWVYDGQPHTETGVSLTADTPYEPVLDHMVYIKDENLLFFTNCGEYINNPAVDVYSPSSGQIVTGNYEITRVIGKVRVESRPLVIQINGEKIYDGTPLTNWQVEYKNDTSLAPGHTLKAEPERVPVEAGTLVSILNSATLKIRDAGGNDVIHNYHLTWQKGELTVHPRPISVRTADAEKVYDGTALTASDVVLTEDSLSLATRQDELYLQVVGRLTRVGQAPNTARFDTFRVLRGDTDVTHNYELVSVTEGTLTVKYDAVVTVTTGSTTKLYDGLPLLCDEYTVEVTQGSLPEGFTVYVDVTGSITRPGSTDNTATVTVWDKDGQDVTPLVTLCLRLGVLTVQESGEDDGRVFGRVFADANGTLYLRMASYGDYNGRGWNLATPYAATLPGGYSLNYLPSAVLQNLKLSTPRRVQFADMRVFLLPYYPEMGGETPVVGSDTVYSNTSITDYNATYYAVGNTAALLEAFDKVPATMKPYLLGTYRDAEKAYRSFVHRQYLSIDGETLAFMKQIMEEQGFDASDTSVIADVASYIRTAAVYNLHYDPALDEASNVAVAFLRDYKEGVCTHYATAATLLYRALGIPARYVTGFATDVREGEWVEIRSPGHAWVEVYVDGLGWVQVEVTGTDSGGTTPDIPPETQKPTLELIPAFRSQVYDGTYLYSPDELVLTPSLEALLNQGYTYTVRTAGTRREIGDGESYVAEFTLYDSSGKDVADQFRLVKKNGLLRVTPPAVEVFLFPLSKTYDGAFAVWGDGDYAILSLPDGLTLELTVTVPADAVGYLTLSELNRGVDRYVSYRLTDRGRDVTADYPLVFTLPADTEETPVLTVRPRAIEVTAASETRVYDGTPLTNAQVYLSRGSLAPGHTLLASAEGNCTSVGTVDNPVGAVVILDEVGNDVTAYYTVTRINGTLTLLASTEG